MELGGDTARAADPNWPKGYSIPWDVMPAQYINWGEVGPGGQIAARELTGHQSVSGEQLHCASLVLYILLIIIFFLSVLLNCLYLNP